MVKFLSSSIVERRVVNWVVRFSAALTILSMYEPVFLSVGMLLFSDLDVATAGSMPMDLGSRKSKFADFLGVFLDFQ